ncbi:MAG: hypothetical protein Q8P98_11615 [Candidatus Rokubacteria bacterium]|nr:hypothetical protein [Candidatus Rokubacteria bacterium]
MASTKTDDGVHVLPPVVADRLEHALDRGDHLDQHLDSTRPLTVRHGGQLLDHLLQYQRHGGDHRVAVKRGRALEAVGDNPEGIEDSR